MKLVIATAAAFLVVVVLTTTTNAVQISVDDGVVHLKDADGYTVDVDGKKQSVIDPKGKTVFTTGGDDDGKSDAFKDFKVNSQPFVWSTWSPSDFFNSFPKEDKEPKAADKA